MLRGLSLSASALSAQALRHETISHNLANAATTGFRRLRLAQHEGPRQVAGRDQATADAPLGAGVLPAGTYVSLEPGAVQATGNPLDIALRGPHFLRVATPDGERLTRDGRLGRNARGELATAAGHPVLGERGAIQLPPGPVRIAEDGTVWAGDRPLDRLALAAVAEGADLQPAGEGLYQAPGGAGAPAAGEAVLVPAALEGANVNAVEELVDMIGALRAYEASQKAIAAQDETLGRAVNDIARL